MTNLYYVEGKIARTNNQIREEILREAENMYNDIFETQKTRFLTEEQVRDLLDIGDMINGLIYHKTFQN